jgi:hypothetical protein
MCGAAAIFASAKEIGQVAKNASCQLTDIAHH